MMEHSKTGSNSPLHVSAEPIVVTPKRGELSSPNVKVSFNASQPHSDASSKNSQENNPLYPNLSETFDNPSPNPDTPLKPNELDPGDCEKNPECEPEELVPPDGGVRAWLVMMGSFLCNGIIFGTINSGGVIFTKLKQIFEDKGIENPASYASLTLSLAIGTTFLVSMVAGVLTDRFGIRKTTVAGGLLATLGMFLSSLFYSEEDVLVFTMGIVFGVGASLVYTPSLVILGHYFRKRIGIVNGIVTAGSSIFTIILTKVLKIFITCFDLQATFQLLSALMAILIVCGFIFKPFFPETKHSKPTGVRPGGASMKAKCHKFFGTFINFEIWKNKKYVIWTLVIPCALFGYFVPYVHLVEYASIVLSEHSTHQNGTLSLHYLNLSASDSQGLGLTSNSSQTITNSSNENVTFVGVNFNESLSEGGYLCSGASNTTESSRDTQSEILIQCIGLTSLLGRILFGFLADRPGVDRILLQQISFFCIGVLTILLTFANSFWMFVVITLGMGLFDGCFISLLGPIALDIVGPEGVSQAIGCLLGMCSIPLTIGPYIAGVLEDNLDSYLIPFLCAGIPPILGCFALCLLKCIKEPPQETSLSRRETEEVGQPPELEALVSDGKSGTNAKDSTSQNPKRFVVIQTESSI